MTEDFKIRINVEKTFLTKRGKVTGKTVGQYLTKNSEKDIILKNYMDITKILSREIGEYFAAGFEPFELFEN